MRSSYPTLPLLLCGSGAVCVRAIFSLLIVCLVRARLLSLWGAWINRQNRLIVGRCLYYKRRVLVQSPTWMLRCPVIPFRFVQTLWRIYGGGRHRTCGAFRAVFTRCYVIWKIEIIQITFKGVLNCWKGCFSLLMLALNKYGKHIKLQNMGKKCKRLNVL